MGRVLLALMVLLLTTPAFAQHLGARQQWQPQTEEDARLQQPVEIEILGRAATAGLPLLAERTGVFLSVAPEDLATVGERKLTVIARGCSLKSTMVQLTEALQECHWDVDVSGDWPVYLLHRNAGTDVQIQDLRRELGEAERSPLRAARLARVEEAKRALEMTPAELAELEGSDLILARAVQEPIARAQIETLLSLPPGAVGEVPVQGKAFTYDQAPPLVKRSAEAVLDVMLAAVQQNPGKYARDSLTAAQVVENAKRWREHADQITIHFTDEGCEFGNGVICEVEVPTVTGPRASWRELVLPPRYIGLGGARPYLRILQATGTPDRAAAMELIGKSEQERMRQQGLSLEQRRRERWVVPTDPRLLAPLALGDGQSMPLTGIQERVSAATGLSIISDYFTTDPVHLTEELRKGLPVYQLLYLACESQGPWSGVAWRRAGSCLTFHNEEWYNRAASEIPEALLLEYIERARASQGRLTLDEVAAFAVALGTRRLASSESIPEELRDAGLVAAMVWRSSLVLYASLSPEQRTKALSTAGLPYADMTSAQRQRMGEAVSQCLPEAAAEEIPEAVFRIVEHTQRRSGSADGVTTTELQLVIAGKPFSQRITLPPERGPHSLPF